MARPRKASTLVTISVRVPKEILDRVDRCAAELQRETPLLEVTRTDAIRYLLGLGLEAHGRRKKRR